MVNDQENLFDFVLERLIEEGNTRQESLAMMATINENILGNIKRAAQMWKMMANPRSIPIKPPVGPANLTNIFKGASVPPTPKPKPFQIGTPPARTVAPQTKLTSTQKGGLVGLAAAIMAPSPTGDGTMDAAVARGDVPAPPAPKLPEPTKVKVQKVDRPKIVLSSPTTSKVSTPKAKPVSIDPDAADNERYTAAKAKGTEEAEKVGMEIWNKKFKDKLSVKPKQPNPALDRFKSL